MTKKDFFVLVLKIFGLYSLTTSLFSVLPANIAHLLTGFTPLSLIWTLIVVVIVAGLFILLVFKAANVVELLKLDRGFDDERIDLGNLRNADIVKLACFFIGGLLILDNIPPFLSYTLFSFKRSFAGLTTDRFENFSWAISALKIVIGYLLVTNYAFVARVFGQAPDRE